MATIYLYDPIERGAAALVIEQLRAAQDDVTVRINSPGGDVAEGIAIFNALKPHKPVVYIDGVAASIASFIAMAGARIVAAENALIMIHNPWTEAAGNASAFRQLADTLDIHRDALVRGYSRTGMARTELLDLLDAETWMGADDALALGFVDEIAEPLRFAAHAPGYFSGYRNTPKELLMRNTAARKPAQGADPQTPASPGSDPGTDLGGVDEKQAFEAFKKGLRSDAVAEAAMKAVMQGLQQRNDSISAMAKGFLHVPGVNDLLVQALANPSIKAEEFSQQLLAKIGQDTVPLFAGQPESGIRAAGMDWSGGRISGGNPVGSDFAQAASDALLVRAGIRVAKPHAGARDVMGMSLPEIIRACIGRGGRAWGGDARTSSFRAAMSTSDFPAILENSLSKALRAGYETEPATFTAWTRHVRVKDFKPQSRVLLGSAPELRTVLEGAEYEYGAIDEDKAVPYAVQKFGRMVQLTWETLVNDDLDAFLRMTQAMGQAALRVEADNIYNTFLQNSGNGPLMQDAKALFHADHGNLAASASALDADALGAARVLLRRQTALGGGVLNLVPRFLLVAPEHEQAAETLLAAAARSMSQGSDNALVPAWLAKLELVVEARLDEDACYLLTSPDNVDTLERAWLEEDDGPKIEEEDGFAVDAKSYKVRHVCGSRWLDWRGAVKLPIA